MGYMAIAFVALIPAMSWYVISRGWPKKMLLFLIPAYALLSYGFYKEFNKLKPK